MDSYGFIWIHMDSYGFIWIHMDSYGVVALAAFSPATQNDLEPARLCTVPQCGLCFFPECLPGSRFCHPERRCEADAQSLHYRLPTIIQHGVPL